MHFEDQIYLDAYLSGLLSEEEFLDSINYYESWKFPWSQYKKIFDFCKKNSIKIIGLNSKGTLFKRDQFAANQLDEIISNYVDHKVVILFGELHILKNKLPKMVEQKLKEKNHLEIKQFIVHQNLDEAFFKCVERNLNVNKTLFLKYSEDEYCLITAPPWLKYESMIDWYENIVEDPDYDFHEFSFQKYYNSFENNEVASENTHLKFNHIFKEVLRFFEIKNDELLKDFEEINLYGRKNLEIVNEKINKTNNKRLVNFYLNQILKGEMIKLPGDSNYFTVNFSINYISYIVGQHLFFKLNDSINKNFTNLLLCYQNLSKFNLLFIIHFISYLTSKLFNPHRKCLCYFEIDQKSVTDHTFSTIKQLIDETNQVEDLLKGVSLNKIVKISRVIAHFYGDLFYQLLIDQNSIVSKNCFKIVQEIFLDFKLDKDFFKEIIQLVNQEIQIKKTKKETILKL